jgi:uncharacterized protein YjbI with pentapeptide repeats
MNWLRFTATLLLFTIRVSASFGMDAALNDSWKGILADGTEITAKDLANILEQHRKWIESDGKNGKKAFLDGADLSNADLMKAKLIGAELNEIKLNSADLRFADLSYAELDGAILKDADIRWSNLSHASLVKAIFDNADLSLSILSDTKLSRSSFQMANLSNSDLKWAILWHSTLNKAILLGADLSNAEFVRADLSSANLKGATLKDAILNETQLEGCDLENVQAFPMHYEPMAGSPPYIPSIANLPELEMLTFKKGPHGLVDLREGFKKYGYREQERQITFALKHRLNQLSLESENIYEKTEANLCHWFF